MREHIKREHIRQSLNLSHLLPLLRRSTKSTMVVGEPWRRSLRLGLSRGIIITESMANITRAAAETRGQERQSLPSRTQPLLGLPLRLLPKPRSQGIAAEQDIPRQDIPEQGTLGPQDILPERLSHKPLDPLQLALRRQVVQWEQRSPRKRFRISSCRVWMDRDRLQPHQPEPQRVASHQREDQRAAHRDLWTS